MSEFLYIIDAHGFLYRNYYALPKLSTSSGQEVGAVYGFTRWLAKLVKEKNPKYIAVCFDSPGGSAKRKEMLDSYKANRKKPDEELIQQLTLAREMVQGVGLKVFSKAGLEADDIIGCIAKKAEKEAGLEIILVTSDKDICQLLSDKVKIWPSGQAKESFKGPEYVKEKFGVEQKYLLDYLSITGDSSDNIPGIAGLGPKTAVDLIEKYGHLDKIIAAAKNGDPGMKPGSIKKIIEHEADALLSRKLVEIDCEEDFEFNLQDALPSGKNPADLAALFAKYEFKNMTGAFENKNNPQSNALPLSDVKFAAWEEVKKNIKGEVIIDTEDGLLLFSAGKDVFLVKKIDGLTPQEKEDLESIVADDSIKKICYDIKLSLYALKINPRKYINVFDCRLAAYTLNPSADMSFAALCAEFLSVSLQADTDEDLLIYQNMYLRDLKEKLENGLKKAAQEEVYGTLELPLSMILLDMETKGVLVDKPWLEHFGHTLERDMDVLQRDIQQLAGGEININSTKQLGALLFEKLHLPVIKKTKTGYSTDEEVLTRLSKLHPIAQKILDYRALSKLLSTYVNNLITMADENLRVHTYFDQTGTVTGRLSSSSPNLQNIPVRTEKGRMLRKAFTAAPGNILVSADYSQIDLRMLAHESGDETLIQAFKEGGDIHAKTAAEVFNVMREMVSSEMRNSAKAINFGIVYGQGPMGLSQVLGIPMREAKEYIDGYFATYKGVKKWIDENVALARKNGYVKTILGHIRFLPEFTAGSAQMSSFAQRAAINTIVQGGSSDIIKKAMLDIFEHFSKTNSEMLLQVHDELIFEMPKDKLDEYSKEIKKLMEQALTLKVPLVAEVKAGPNWYDMEKLKI